MNKNAQGFSKILLVVSTIGHGPLDGYAWNKGELTKTQIRIYMQTNCIRFLTKIGL